MPLAAALLQGRHCAYMGKTLAQIDNDTAKMLVAVPPVEPATQARVMRSLRRSVPFDVQMASELYWGQRKEYYSLDDDIGPMRLPYPEMWMEWYIPATGYRGGKRYTEAHTPARFATYLYERRLDEDTVLVTVQFMAEAQNDNQPPGKERPILLSEMPFSFEVDQQGTYRHATLTAHQPKDLPAKPLRMMTEEANSCLFTVALALNLINCKNVTTAKAGNIAVRRSGREKRQGAQPMAFHTIVLPGMTVERGRVSRRQAAANEEVLRQHMVRGHFKTFTNERPLLGRHTGTYWWNPAVRGNAKRGKVIQDYEIGARA